MKAINTQNVSCVILLHFAMYACLLLLHVTIMSVQLFMSLLSVCWKYLKDVLMCGWT